MTTATHERIVWLVTITNRTSAKPTAYGIFDNAISMSNSLRTLGLNQSDGHELRNPDGTVAAFIFDGPECYASIAMMPAGMAHAVTDLDAPLIDVPDAWEE